MVQIEVNIYLPCASALIQNEDSNTISKAMSIVQDQTKEVLSRDWAIRYCLTDDSTAKQRAVQIAFPANDSVYRAIYHLHYKWHSKITLDRQLSSKQLHKANKHLKAALFSRRSKASCDQSIQAALDSILDGTKITRRKKQQDPKKYIREEQQATKQSWANYAR